MYCIIHHHQAFLQYPIYFGAFQDQTRIRQIVDTYREEYPQIIVELKNSARSGLNSVLVEQFSHCIGMFPVGSLVELNSREVAIILTHNRSQRFHPKVMVILDAKKQPYEKPFELDLKSTKPAPSGVPYEIVRDLPLGAYNIDASQYYL